MSESPVDTRDGHINHQGHGSESKNDPAQVEERPVSSQGTTTLSEKPIPPKSVDTSEAEIVDEKKVEESGDGQGGDETDYSSKATRKTEFKHFLV
jgi:hypothetical protein